MSGKEEIKEVIRVRTRERERGKKKERGDIKIERGKINIRCLIYAEREERKRKT